MKFITFRKFDDYLKGIDRLIIHGYTWYFIEEIKGHYDFIDYMRKMQPGVIFMDVIIFTKDKYITLMKNPDEGTEEVSLFELLSQGRETDSKNMQDLLR